MYENAYSKVGLKNSVYTDTDALKFRFRDFAEWYDKYGSKSIVRHWPEIEKIDPRYKMHTLYNPDTKVFGSFENELSENNYFYSPQKKTWFNCLINDDGSITNIKMGCKGVSPRSIVIPNKFVYEELKTKSNEEKLEYYKEHKNDILYNEETKGGKAYDFFESLADNGEAYVLCMAFNKVVKNSKQNVNIDDEHKFNNLNNKIKVNYTLKKIVVN